MKAKNNVQKTNLKTAMVFFSLIFFSVAVSAQNHGRGLLADNLSKKSKQKAEVVDSTPVGVPVYYRKVTEQVLQLESWMVYGKLFTETGNLSFDSCNSPNVGVIFKLIDEKKMEIEQWMIESDFWE